uniref:Copper type II ascorbate-dependent monooxygenase N-terminal domain-containing protein n=1 Tax=Meloidogyne enterolobii TaxID=390850 RepID=A0A6V7X8P4_MELEN|nr:unnamed protein product [Meloidogyne enterolobii]
MEGSRPFIICYMEVPPKTNLQTMEIRANSVLIPPQTTTYYCSIIELPPQLKQTKHHAIKYEAVITPGNKQFVHHFEVFHCQTPTRPFAGDCSTAKPTEAKVVLKFWLLGLWGRMFF